MQLKCCQYFELHYICIKKRLVFIHYKHNSALIPFFVGLTFFGISGSEREEDHVMSHNDMSLATVLLWHWRVGSFFYT